MLTRDAAMETEEGEKEVPAKKPKTEPVLVRPSLDFKTESTRELSNFNFQWTKPCTSMI